MITAAAGMRLGPYQLAELVGSGGMGEVWKAFDPRLHRIVAIKIGREEFSERFLREARSIAALNHPHICQIYDVGPNYIVMEYIDGKPLAGPLPLHRALEYGVQICEALNAAHGNRIVHRDLKPENILVAKSGVKLLDFGIAKIIAGANPCNDSRTETIDVTDERRIVGTLRYMSPEQVQGREVDTRSDIFSLGAVLFELLSGRRAFDGDTPADVIASILKDEPPQLVRVKPSIPPGVDHLIRTCFAKDPADRWQSARELKHALTWIESQSGATKSLVFRQAWLVSVALLVGMCAGAGLIYWLKPAYVGPLSIEAVTYSGHDSSPAASPDGRTIAFTSDRDGASRIWLKQLESGTEVALTSGPDDYARFSPNGATILFSRNEQRHRALYRVPTVGGECKKIVDDAIDGDYSPDGEQIAFVRWTNEDKGEDSIVALASVDGSNIREIARMPKTRLNWPRWSPNGATIAAVTSVPGQPRLKLSLLDRNGGHQRAIDVSGPTRSISSVAWLADNRTVVFMRGERTAPVKAELVLHDTKTQLQRTIAWQCCSFFLDTMGSGRLVFDSEATRSGLLQVTEGGRKQRWLSQANSADRQPVYSPDGTRLAFASNRNGKINIWQILLRTGAVSRLTEGSPTDYDPAFTPDGNRLIFSSDRTGHFEIYIANADGSNTKQVTHDGSDDENATMTADGQWIVYSHRAQESGIWKIHPDGTGATPILHCNCFNPEVSPDGRYALYLTSPRPDLTDIHVLRISDGSVTPFVIQCQLHRRTGITIGRARWIASEPRGIPKAIAFIGQDERGVPGVYIQDFDSGRDTTNTRRQLFSLNPRVPLETFGISPDGQSSIVSVINDTSVIMLASDVPGINAVALK